MEKDNKGMPQDTARQEQEITTIKLDQLTKSRLDKFKEHEKESYNELINKLLNILNISRKNPGLSDRILANIEHSISLRKIYTNPELYRDQIEERRPRKLDRFKQA